MKKFLAAILIVILCVSMLSSCVVVVTDEEAEWFDGYNDLDLDKYGEVFSDNKENFTEEKGINISKFATIQVSSQKVYSGNLLTLNENNRYKGTPRVVNLQDRADRPKTSEGKNSYTILTSDRDRYCLTEEAAVALNKMLGDFYKAKKDDNIIISGAYDFYEFDSQDAIFSSGEAVELSCFYDYENAGLNDKRSIVSVDMYNWIYVNAHKYGFVAITSSSNIFRYIGVTHATAAKAKGVSIDKYLQVLNSSTYESPVILSDIAVAYYCRMDDVKIPQNYAYEISGNNQDGVIVTVDLSKKI